MTRITRAPRHPAYPPPSRPRTLEERRAAAIAQAAVMEVLG